MTTILLVDDEFDSLMILELLLSMEGYHVVTARDGVEACERLANEKPCLIVTDMMMPRMDGLRLCRRVRENPATAKLPIILYSAARLEGTDTLGLYNLALPKPVDFDVLLNAIRELLGRP